MSKDIRSTPSLTPPTSPGSIKVTLARGVLDMSSARRSRPALRMADKRQRDSAGAAAVADWRVRGDWISGLRYFKTVTGLIAQQLVSGGN
jgi:hypothetical protein